MKKTYPKNKILSLLSLLLFLALSSCISEEPDRSSLEPGDKCPDFTVTLSDGTLFSTSLQEKETLIVFFNTGCSDCRKEFPEIEKVYRNILALKYPINVIGISRSEDAASVEAYWQEHGLTFPYSAQEDAEIYHLFAKSVIPRIYLVSKKNIITHTWDDKDMPNELELMAAFSKVIYQPVL